MNPIDLLLSRLEGIKATGPGKYVARCPAHSDKHPSLAIKEADDGAVLLFCHAGCGIDEIAGAAGLELSELFPPRSPQGRKPERRPFNASDLLGLAAWESLVASIISSDLAHGKPTDRNRLITAAARLRRMAEVAHVR
jgi:hypothetical protein